MILRHNKPSPIRTKIPITAVTTPMAIFALFDSPWSWSGPLLPPDVGEGSECEALVCTELALLAEA